MSGRVGGATLTQLMLDVLAARPEAIYTTSTLDPRPSALDPRPSTLDPRPSALGPRPSTLDPRPSALNPGIFSEPSASASAEPSSEP